MEKSLLIPEEVEWSKYRKDKYCVNFDNRLLRLSIMEKINSNNFICVPVDMYHSFYSWTKKKING
ncbi:hypothetical protein NPIL_248951, partial [Nephila pilipes]